MRSVSKFWCCLRDETETNTVFIAITKSCHISIAAAAVKYSDMQLINRDLPYCHILVQPLINLPFPCLARNTETLTLCSERIRDPSAMAENKSRNLVYMIGRQNIESNHVIRPEKIYVLCF